MTAASSVKADTIQSLGSIITAGQPITVGNATYSNFVLTGTISPANLQVDMSSTATASSIVFSVANGSWKTGTPDDSSRILFDVSFAKPVTSVGLDFVATGQQSAVASVGETITDSIKNVDYSNGVLTDGAGTRPDNLFDSVTLATPATSLHILKSIDIAGSGSASITSVENVYSTPEPASLSILALGVVPFLRRRRAV